MRPTRALTISALALLAFTAPASARDKIIGVSWANLTAAHWQLDEAAMRRAVELQGDKLISVDAQGSADTQLASINDLISQGANALIVQPVDAGALQPALTAAASEKIPVIAYSQPVEDASVLWVGFDAAAAGRLQIENIARLAPEGDYARLAVRADADAQAMAEGAAAALALLPAIKIATDLALDQANADEGATALTDAITKGAKPLAVVATDDRLAAGAIVSLTAAGLSAVPVAGSGADAEALNRIAAGTQALTIWQDPRLAGKAAGAAASALAAGTSPAALEGARSAKTAAGTEVSAILLKPATVTRANVGALAAAGWVSKDDLCRNVDAAVFPLCQ